MVRAGVRSAVELHKITGINRSTLSLKMSGSRKWQIEDLQVIASALGTTISYLIGETDDPAPGHAAGDDYVVAPAGELVRRLEFLGVERGSVSLVPGADETQIGALRRELEALALSKNVPIEYLTEFADESAADRVEALVEFTRTAEASGVQRIAARSLGSLSAEELRALARVIRTA